MNGGLDDRGPRWIFPVLVAGAVVLALVLWLAFRLHHGAAAAHGPAPAPPPAKFVNLISPRGELSAVPTLFEWHPIEGASRYTVKIEDADAVWPLFVRSTTSPVLSLEPAEATAFQPGRVYVWEVQAFDDRGSLSASGGTQFRLPSPSPSP